MIETVEGEEATAAVIIFINQVYGQSHILSINLRSQYDFL